MFLSHPFPHAFGLDIDDLSISLVQLEQHYPIGRPNYFSMANLRTTSLPPGCIVNGEIQQPEAVRRKILHLLGDGGAYKPLKVPWVVANLPEPKTFLKLIEIGTPTKDLLPDDIRYHAAKHLPFELDDTYLDWQIITEGEAKTELLLGAVTKTIADSYTYLLEAAGLNPLALEIEGIALARALITDAKDYTGEARAILDLGQTRSSVIVFDKNVIQFSSSIRFSTELVTTAISQGLKISHEEAGKLLAENGINYLKKHPKYLKIIDDLVSGLIGEIKQVLHFYRDHFVGSNPITHITMSGQIASLANLDTIISQKLKISAAPGNTWKNISSDSVSQEKIVRGLSLSTGIGLALRAARNPLHED